MSSGYQFTEDLHTRQEVDSVIIVHANQLGLQTPLGAAASRQAEYPESEPELRT